MNHWIVKGAIAALLLTGLLSTCTNPTQVGADLLESDRAVVDFTDTISLEATTVQLDTELVYLPGAIILNNYLLGNYDDPVFGQVNHSIFFRFRLLSDFSGEIVPDFRGQPIDSVVLVLPLDTTLAASYGNINEPITVELFELSDTLPLDQRLTSDFRVATQINPLLTETIIPEFSDRIVTTNASDIVPDSLAAPHLRFRMPQSFIDRIGGNSIGTSLTSDSILRQATAFPGFLIQVAPGGTGGILDLDLQENYGGLYTHYRRGGDTVEVYQFPLANRYSNYEHTYTNSVVEPFINDPTGDSLAFVQGAAGLATKIDLSGLEDLRGQLVNQAELEIFVPNLPEDDTTTYIPTEQLLLLYPLESGTLVPVTDIQVTLPQFQIVFGGQPQMVDGGTIYRMDLSVHMQRILDGTDDIPPTLYLVNRRILFTSTLLLPIGDIPSRVVLAGPNAINHPMRLKVAFTRLF